MKQHTMRCCSLGISGKKCPRRSYECMSRTSKQNASSSGICYASVSAGTGASRRDADIEQ